MKTGTVTPEQFEPGPLYADTYNETPAQEELKTGTVTPEQFEPGPLYADTYNETPVQEELKTGTVTPEQFEPGPLYADTYNETSVQEELKTGTVTPEQFERNPLYADAPLDSRSAVSEIGADPLMQIYENPKKTRAEDIPSKPFTSADIARLGIFDTNVASPFDNEAEDAGVVSPFDLTDASVASLFGSPESDGNAAQMSFGTAVTKEEPVSDAESAAKESPTDGIPYYNKRDAAAELKQNQKIQEIISQPVIFPFDEDTGYVEPELEEDDYDDPEDETFTSAETVVEDIREPAEEYGDDDYDNGELTDSETARVPAAEYDDRDEYYPDKKASRKAAKEEKGKKKKKTQRAAAKDDEAGDTQMSPAKWLVILMDILVVVAVLVIAAFAILKLAPDSGVAHILDQGVTKVAELFSGSDSSADDSGGSSSANDDFIAPMPNKEALVNAQAGFNNRNIAEVVYDPNAGYDSNRTYTIKGISGAKPIENDYWTTDDKGYVLYDEAAVAAVIRFNSELVSYISGQQSEIISLLETGSKEETALSNYASSVTALEFRKLGIGEILTDGTYFYVFTNETAAETRNGASIEINSSKVYKLAADPVVSEMKIVEIETVA
ncbi:MAG: hypothetical protein LBL36_05650 [Clostridiales Family XIII bacterium]|nr:hypothetical protein [Clostridiales Family XIII bacterium]